MGKRRRVAAPSAPSGPREVDKADARLGPITTYEDIADSEEEYFGDKDRILLDDGPKSKRRKADKVIDDFLEVSDEEVLAHSDDDSDDPDEELARLSTLQRKNKKNKKSQAAAVSDEEAPSKDAEDEDEGWQGATRKDFYNADVIETEADAQEEEAEAKRLQQKKLAQMDEADFIFNEDEWRNEPDEETNASGGQVVTELLKDIEIADDMSPEDRYSLLQSRYPEFDHLVDEFEQLQPRLVSLQEEAQGKSTKSMEVVKYWTLGCYVASLASYLAILTSPARESHDAKVSMAPAMLRDHEIMSTLMNCREAWQLVKDRQSTMVKANTVNGIYDTGAADYDMVSVPSGEKASETGAENVTHKPRKKLSKAEKAKAKAVEASIAELDDLLVQGQKPRKPKARVSEKLDDDHSDFGEEDGLDARTAADKAAKKKSLRFYTSQIVQKAAKRNEAGRDAGGDIDIPYRERLRDRQARLNEEAANRGRGKAGKDAALGGNDDDDDEGALAREVRNDEDDYYDMVAHRSKAKKEAKTERRDLAATASALDRIVETSAIDQDGRRKITYQIEKNKGLTPSRKKEVRNPRVKKRLKYEAKKKKLGSMRPVYKGGEGKGGYQGEKSGIKTNLVKSTKL